MAEARTIVIDPVTRIEGHSKITIHLDEQGKVEDARFHVTQFRSFEKFCEGRPFAEMPSLMARICGICPVSHLIASSKACDALLAVKIPPAADKLRRIFGIAQVVQSHALSLFHLSSPDLLLGMDSDPAESHLFGVYAKNPGRPATASRCASSASRSSSGSAASAFIPPGWCPAASAIRSHRKTATRFSRRFPRPWPWRCAAWNG